MEFNDGLNGEGEGLLDSKKEEEKGDKDMVDQDLDWMAQEPLTLLESLHRMLRHSEKLLSKFDPDNKTKAKHHINDFYIHLRMLEVWYDDVACRIFLSH